MSKYTVWRSGSGHMNCWVALPMNLGEYEANTFIDACVQATDCLDKDEWTFSVVDGVMYIESGKITEFGHRTGRYGLFPTEAEAMQETLRRFDRENADEYKRLTGRDAEPGKLRCWERFAIPQAMYDSLRKPFIANVCLERQKMLIWNDIDDVQDFSLAKDSAVNLIANHGHPMLDMCMNCRLRTI